MSEQDYIGTELELFAHATRWKSYLRREFAPDMGGRVLEVGSGLGGTTKALCDGSQKSWLCLEPDPSLHGQLASELSAGRLPACCTARQGTVADLKDEGSVFDTILYVDVLEHVEEDAAELRLASELLEPGGRLIVLSPAHQWLFSPFDESIGHFRRYDRRSYEAIAPPGLACRRISYLDSVGLLASAANRYLLRSSMPTLSQILTWDRRLVPLSRLLDPILFHRVGKSILAVWQAPEV